jgi:hypothetical protein
MCAVQFQRNKEKNDRKNQQHRSWNNPITLAWCEKINGVKLLKYLKIDILAEKSQGFVIHINTYK